MNKEELALRHPGVRELMSYFEYDHLPEPLRGYSQQCYYLADWMVDHLGDSAELTAGLRKLLEAKDCFVRTALTQGKCNG